MGPNGLGACSADPERPAPGKDVSHAGEARLAAQSSCS